MVLSQQVLDEKPANPVDVLETALLNKKAAGGAGNTEVVGPAAVSSIQQLLLGMHVLLLVRTLCCGIQRLTFPHLC